VSGKKKEKELFFERGKKTGDAEIVLKKKELRCDRGR